MSDHDIEPQLIPARRHNKLALESKHKVVRDIYTRLKEGNPSESFNRLCSQAFTISNDLYGNGHCSAFECAKGYTRPICSGKMPVAIPQEVLDAQKERIAKRKLNLILRSKAVQDITLEIGDIVQVFLKQSGEKRGKWSDPKTVIDFNSKSGIVTVPGSRGQSMKVAVEDVRYALSSQLADEIRRASDDLDALIDNALAVGPDSDDGVEETVYPTTHNEDIIDDFNPSPSVTSARDSTGGATAETGEDCERTVFDCELKNCNEEDATATTPTNCEHTEEDRLGPWNVSYYLNLQNEKAQDAPQNISAADAVAPLETITPGTCITSIAQETLQKYFNLFGGKEFSLREAEGLFFMGSG